MLIESAPLDGVLIVRPRRFDDDRGFFVETWNRRTFAAQSLDRDFVQDNLSYSASAGTVRGLHFQRPPHAQAKLVRCARGALFDVAVDVRRGSATYGRWFGLELSAENGAQLFIPEGFLHGFMTLTDDCELAYKCSAHYDRASEGAVRWDSCGIDWPRLAAQPVLSARDAEAPGFDGFETPFDVAGRP